MLHHPFSSRRTILLTAALLLAVSGIGCAFAMRPHHGSRPAHDQIAGLEEQWRTATLAADAATMDKLLSDDFVGISWTGQVNTKQMQLDRLSSRSLSLKRMDVSESKIKIVGTVAIVTSRAEVEGSNEGKVIDGAFRYTRIYQRLPSGTWKLTNSEATRIPPGHGHHPPDQPSTPSSPPVAPPS